MTACSKDRVVVNDNFTLNGDIINIYSSVQNLGRDMGHSDQNCKLYMRINYVISKFGSCGMDIGNVRFVPIV